MMSKRFAPLGEPKEGSRFANLAERLNDPLPGEPSYREGDYEAPRGNASSRLKAFRERPAGNATKADKPKASTAPVTPPTPPTPAEAAQKAAEAAKARHAAVMASAHVHGREKQASKFLMASCNASAEFRTSTAIIAQLAKLPTDAQLAAVEKHLRSKAAQKVWNRAYGIDEPKAASAAKPMSKAQAVWAKAWGIAEQEPKQASKGNAAESVWDRAYAKMERAKA